MKPISQEFQEVKAQYEALPYPPRDPADEDQRLVITDGDCLYEVNHYCFRGQQDFQDRFRVLVAGGGTGDNAIFLAHQLRDTNAEIVYLDLSSASCDIAKARAERRGLTNIKWVVDSILNIPKLELGKFDYISSTGVIHHMPSPEAGLQTLADSLQDNGGMMIMVYGRYGRRAIYPLQQLFRQVISADANREQKISIARNIISNLPQTNPLVRDAHFWRNEIATDPDLYDLLLHSIDNCYSVSEIYDLAESADLNVISFAGIEKTRYQLDTHLNNKNILSKYSQLTQREQQHMAELVFSKQLKHSFYLSKQKDSIANLKDESLAVLLMNDMHQRQEEFYQQLTEGQDVRIDTVFDGMDKVVTVRGNKITKQCFKYFDGHHSVKDIIKLVKKDVKRASDEQIKNEIQKVYKEFHALRWMYLQNPNVKLWEA